MAIPVGASLVYRRLFAVVLLASTAAASDWQQPASQLAQRIAGITGPGAVAVTLVNRSSLPTADADEINRKLSSELAAFGVREAPAEQAAATVEVSVSENLQGYLLVTEIHQGTNEPVVVMVAVPGTVQPSENLSATPLTLNKALLWADENRILDATVINSPPLLIVLEPERIGLFHLQNTQWRLEQFLPLVHVRPWPRDLRGRLIVRKDHLFDAYLPGVYCRSGTSAPLTVTCDDSDDPWPLTGNPKDLSAFFSGARNFFTGALSPGIQKQTTAPPFYSAAPLPRDNYTLWVLAGVDGNVHLLDGVADQVLRQLVWGSDVASIRSSCGLGWQILATSNEDSSTDNVRAFEIPDREPIAMSAPVDFAGRITALWTDSDAAGVTAIARNLATGKYEAYRLSIDCRH
jgi:hypothetical protein